MNAAIVTSKGQVTIPKPVRDALGLREHDKVVFVVVGRRAFLVPIRQGELGCLRGMAKQRWIGLGAPTRKGERDAARLHVAQHVVGESVTE